MYVVFDNEECKSRNNNNDANSAFWKGWLVAVAHTHTGPDSSGCAAAGGQLNAAPASTKAFNPSLTAGIGNFRFSKVGIKESINSV